MKVIVPLLYILKEWTEHSILLFGLMFIDLHVNLTGQRLVFTSYLTLDYEDFLMQDMHSARYLKMPGL